MIDPREHLLPIQQQALLALARIRSERDHLLFSMALGTGLSGKALSSLNVRDISKDGTKVESEEIPISTLLQTRPMTKKITKPSRL